jgi:hypothetical protein
MNSIRGRRDWGILTLCIVLGLAWIRLDGTLVSAYVSVALWAVLIVALGEWHA